MQLQQYSKAVAGENSDAKLTACFRLDMGFYGCADAYAHRDRHGSSLSRVDIFFTKYDICALHVMEQNEIIGQVRYQPQGGLTRCPVELDRDNVTPGLLVCRASAQKK
jgi:hypothetical protein